MSSEKWCHKHKITYALFCPPCNLEAKMNETDFEAPSLAEKLVPPKKDRVDPSKLGKGYKADEDKLRLDLLPPGPLMDVAQVMTMGAKKYSDRNWEAGMDWSRPYAAALRHLLKWWSGEDYDKVDGQHHLASVAWCALVLLEYTRTHPEKDNRPYKALEEVLRETTVLFRRKS